MPAGGLASVQRAGKYLFGARLCRRQGTGPQLTYAPNVSGGGWLGTPTTLSLSSCVCSESGVATFLRVPTCEVTTNRRRARQTIAGERPCKL